MALEAVGSSPIFHPKNRQPMHFVHRLSVCVGLEKGDGEAGTKLLDTQFCQPEGV